jgi:hypothetical protein
MLFDRLDLKRLRRDLASASARCRELKLVLRRTWTRPMADEQRALAHAAWRVTELCVLLAQRRGRWHLAAPRDASWDREKEQTRIAERVLRDYAVADEAHDPPAEAQAP